MDLNQAELVFFSPTNTSKKIVQAIGKGLACEQLKEVDLTFENKQEQSFEQAPVIIGVPVYAGRVAATAVARMRAALHGQGQPAILVVVYGNRAYEDALLELNNLAVELGFIPVAGAAFIGEHSFADEKRPIATGRPDSQDVQAAQNFGAQVRKKLLGIDDLTQLPALKIPGNFPYRDGVKPADISPETQVELCTLCGECAKVCPTQAISVKEKIETDKSGCIRCCACVKVCSNQARTFDLPGIEKIRAFLHSEHSQRKQPEIFC